MNTCSLTNKGVYSKTVPIQESESDRAIIRESVLIQGRTPIRAPNQRGDVISRDNIYSRDGAYSSERTYLFERESARLFNGERLSYLTKEACLQIGDYSTDGVYLIVGAYSRASLYSNKVRC